MARVIALCLAIVGGLGLVAPTPAATSGQATGEINFSLGTFGCSVRATAKDGTTIVAMGAALTRLTFLGGDSFADPKVGWMCEGSFTSVGLPSPGPLVLTGLTCSLDGGAHPPPIPFGNLKHPGTATFFANGDIRLVCPPSERS